MTDKSTSATILYLASNPIPSTAANAVHVMHMVDAIMREGVNISVLAPPAGAPADSAQQNIASLYGVQFPVRVKSIPYPWKRGSVALFCAQVGWELLLQRPKYVYGRHLETCIVACRFGFSTFYEAHRPVWQESEKKRSRFQALIRLRSFRGVVVISKALRQELLHDYPQLESRVLVAPDGAPLRPQSPLPLRLAGDRFRVVYAGSLYPGKGMEILQAVAPLCPWAQFQILGGSDTEVQQWRSKMHSGLNNVEFLGYRSHAQVNDQLAQADALVAPYQAQVHTHGGGTDIARWMSPLKVFEYMAANRPMLASDLPVLREVLTDRHNALLASPDDAQSWAAALSELRDSPSLAASIAETARREFEQHYTWDARAKKIMQFINSGAGTGGKHA